MRQAAGGAHRERRAAGGPLMITAAALLGTGGCCSKAWERQDYHAGLASRIAQDVSYPHRLGFCAGKLAVLACVEPSCLEQVVACAAGRQPFNQAGWWQRSSERRPIASAERLLWAARAVLVRYSISANVTYQPIVFKGAGLSPAA